MHLGRIIPDNEIANSPFMGIDKAFLGREFEQAEQLGAAHFFVHPVDVGRVVADV